MTKYLSINSGDFWIDVNLEKVTDIRMQEWRKIVKLAERFYDPDDFDYNMDNAYHFFVGAIMEAKREKDAKTEKALVKRFDVLRVSVERKAWKGGKTA